MREMTLDEIEASLEIDIWLILGLRQEQSENTEIGEEKKE